MYWRALQELVNGPLNVANSGPLLDAKYNAFVANGLSVENPNSNIKPWLSQAQSSIASQLAAVNATSFTVNATVTVSNNVAYVTGTAPVNVATVWINGVAYPLTWTTLTSWTVTVPLVNGTNNLTCRAWTATASRSPGDSNSVSVIYNGTNPSPVGQVVINEIMYDPAVPTRSLSSSTTTPPTRPLICPAGSCTAGLHVPGRLDHRADQLSGAGGEPRGLRRRPMARRSRSLTRSAAPCPRTARR